MHFCDVCKNMYYIKIAEDDPNKLSYYCRNCGHINETLTVDNTVITNTVTTNTQDLSYIINKYTKLDPTLPRIDKIPCPNESCSTNNIDTPTPREIIYIRYDEQNIKYIYLCSTCDTVWTLDK